jgi:hypothetical protein
VVHDGEVGGRVDNEGQARVVGREVLEAGKVEGSKGSEGGGSSTGLDVILGKAIGFEGQESSRLVEKSVDKSL